MKAEYTATEIYRKGEIVFLPPETADERTALGRVLSVCKDKYGGMVRVTFTPPYKPRRTGEGSANHHLNGHLVQICNETGQDYDAIKYMVKMLAVEHLEYPYTTVAGHILPKPEHECNSMECAKLIDAVHMLAAELGIELRETNDE